MAETLRRITQEPAQLSHGPAIALFTSSFAKAVDTSPRPQELSVKDRAAEVDLYMRMRDIFDDAADASVPGNVFNKQRSWLNRQTLGRVPTIKGYPRFISERRDEVVRESSRLEKIYDSVSPNNELLKNRQPRQQQQLPEEIGGAIEQLRRAYIETHATSYQLTEKRIGEIQDNAAYALPDYEGEQQEKLLELSGVEPEFVESIRDSITKSNKYFWRWEAVKEVGGNAVALAVALALRDKLQVPLSDGATYMAGNVGYYAPLVPLAASDVKTQEEIGYSSNPFAAGIEVKGRKMGERKKRLFAFSSRAVPEGAKNWLYNFIPFLPIQGAELYYLAATFSAGVGHILQAGWGFNRIRQARKEGIDLKSLRARSASNLALPNKSEIETLPLEVFVDNAHNEMTVYSLETSD